MLISDLSLCVPDPELNLVTLEIEDGRLKYGAFVGLAYLALYVAFILGHTPVAKPVEHEVRILRYTEAKSYRNDNASAYRGWLFIPVLWVNVLVVCLYIVNTIGIIYTQGWSGTPVVVRILICVCFAPFVMGLLDGFLRCDLRCFWGMCYSAPFALPLMLWFNVWLPAYTTTRLSDLTWGNRDTASLDESMKALERARNGRRVAKTLILFNSSIALGVILIMQKYASAFPIFVVSYTVVLSFTYVISFFDLVMRFLSCTHLDPSDDEPVIVEEDETDSDELCGGCGGCGDDEMDGGSDGYIEMDDGVVKLQEPVQANDIVDEYVNMAEQQTHESSPAALELQNPVEADKAVVEGETK